MADNPLRVAFTDARHHARERGIEWKLEYWEWLQIWQDSGHLSERGCRKGQWVMSRKGDRGGYESGNVAIVRVETNNDEGKRTRKTNPSRRLTPAR